jgi:16S rRNA (cytosine1402-N4)-methyltransferase
MTMAALRIDGPDPFEHITVMPHEVVEAFTPLQGGVFVDATVGGGGHTDFLLSAFPDSRVLAFDRDEEALEAAAAHLERYGDRVEFIHATFDRIPEQLAARNIESIDGLVADLGVSTPQLNRADRGMSFRYAGPIDMRMDRSSDETALEMIRRLDQDELANVIYEYGEERASRRIARCIKQALAHNELHTTVDIRRAVVRAVGPRRVGGVDPATRTFQALRIAVNDELRQLDALLLVAASIVRVGGVIAVISFHSLEDRRVKRALLNRAVWQRISSKPIIAGEQERVENPRSRSAKLRIARRVSDSDAPDSDSDVFSDSDWPPEVEIER